MVTLLRRAFSRFPFTTPVPTATATLVSAPLYPRVRCRSLTGQRSVQGYKGVRFLAGDYGKKQKGPRKPPVTERRKPLNVAERRQSGTVHSCLCAAATGTMVLRRAFSRLHSITPVPSPMLTLVSAPLYPRVRCRSLTGRRSVQGYKGGRFLAKKTPAKNKTAADAASNRGANAATCGKLKN